MLRRQSRRALEKKKRKLSHHLWSAEKSTGKLRLQRSGFFDEDASEDGDAQTSVARARRSASKARKRAMPPRDLKDAAQALFGVWGATLVDDNTFIKVIPKALVARFNAKANTGAPPKTYSWVELGNAAGSEKINLAKTAVVDGMRTRLIAKELNIPFLVAAELLSKIDGMDMIKLKAAVHGVKNESARSAYREQGTLGKIVKTAFTKFKGRKLAVDEKAKAYFESYFGPYGQEMVAEIQRRVRADLASRWLTKNGVDAAAAEYWSNYYSDSGYGAELVAEIPRRISPAN